MGEREWGGVTEALGQYVVLTMIIMITCMLKRLTMQTLLGLLINKAVLKTGCGGIGERVGGALLGRRASGDVTG